MDGNANSYQKNSLLTSFYPKTQKRDNPQPPSIQFLSVNNRRNRDLYRIKGGTSKSKIEQENRPYLNFQEYVDCVYRSKRSAHHPGFQLVNQNAAQWHLPDYGTAHTLLNQASKQDYQYLIDAQTEDHPPSQSKQKFFLESNPNQNNKELPSEVDQQSKCEADNDSCTPSITWRQKWSSSRNKVNQFILTDDEKIQLINQVQKCIQDTSPYHMQVQVNIQHQQQLQNPSFTNLHNSKPQLQARFDAPAVKRNELKTKQQKIQENYQNMFHLNRSESPSKKVAQHPSAQPVLPAQAMFKMGQRGVDLKNQTVIMLQNNGIRPDDNLRNDSCVELTPKILVTPKHKHNLAQAKCLSTTKQLLSHEPVVVSRQLFSPTNSKKSQPHRPKLNLRVYNQESGTGVQQFDHQDSIKYYLTKLEKIRKNGKPTQTPTKSFKSSTSGNKQNFNMTCFM